MPGVGCGPCIGLPAPDTTRAEAAFVTPTFAACAGAAGTHAGPGHAPRRPLRGPSAGGSVRHLAGGGTVSVLDPHDVPGAARRRRGDRASLTATVPASGAAALGGHRPEPGLDLGHHAPVESTQVGHLPALRGARSVLALRRRLDGGHAGNGDPSPAAGQRRMPEAGHRAGTTHPAPGPRCADDGQDVFLSC